MKSPRLYRIGKGPAFPIANLSKRHPLWGMPAGLFNATAPEHRVQAAAHFIDANRSILTNRSKPVTEAAGSKPRALRSLASAGLMATLAAPSAGMVGSARGNH